MRARLRDVYLILLLHFVQHRTFTIGFANGSLLDAPRYAFCVAGQIRSFSRTQESIRTELVDKFGDPRAVVRDLFLVLDPHCTEVHEHAVTANREYCDGTVDARAVRRWKPKLRWKDIRIFDVPYNRSESIVPENDCNREEGVRQIPTREKYYDSSYYHMHLKQGMCYELVKRYERRVGVRYDWIVSTRPDRAWKHAYTGELDPEFVYTIDDCNVLDKGPLICDAVYVVPRAYGDVVYAAKDQIGRCVDLDTNGNHTSIESYPPCHVKEWTSRDGTPPECLFSAYLTDAGLGDRVRALTP